MENGLIRYESFPVQTKFRDELIAKLGLITLAEQHLPPVITEGLYDKTLDELREVTEEEICNQNTAN